MLFPSSSVGSTIRQRQRTARSGNIIGDIWGKDPSKAVWNLRKWTIIDKQVTSSPSSRCVGGHVFQVTCVLKLMTDEPHEITNVYSQKIQITDFFINTDYSKCSSNLMGSIGR